jgi:rhodanese-related sulfurtransferase
MPLFMLLALQEVEFTKDGFDVLKAALREKTAILVDVRETSEWDEGHLEDARSFPLSALKKAAAEDVGKRLPAKGVVYLHCRAGGRALTAAGLLKKLGYAVKPLKPGFEELRRAGFPEASR